VQALYGSGRPSQNRVDGGGTLVSAGVNGMSMTGMSTKYTEDLAGGMSKILVASTGGAMRDDGGHRILRLARS